MTRSAWLSTALAVTFVAVPALSKPTEAEKARKTVEKKLDGFEKSYDPTKDLSRKNPDKLDKDIAELDEAMAALKAVDAAAADALAARRDALVNAAKEGTSSASAAKADDEFNKRLQKVQEQTDPEKKRLDSLDAATIKRLRDDLDRVIARLDPSARKPYEDRRDAWYSKLQEDITAARLARLRGEVADKVPELKSALGVEPIAAMKPTWCEGVEAALAKVYSNYHVGGLNDPEPIGVRPLMNAVTFSCFDPDFSLRQQWVAYFRQTLSNRFGLSAATNERLMKLGAALVVAGNEAVARQQKDVCAQFGSLDTGALEGRFSRALERFGLGCPGRLVDQANGVPLNAIDVPNGISSQLAAAVLANTLTTQGFHSNDGRLTGFAVANAVLALDPAKFESELSGWKLNDLGALNAIETFYGVARAMKALEAEARARSAAVLLEAPKKGAQAFVASLSNTRSAIEVALSLEDQKRAGSLKGCAAKLYPDLAAAVKGQTASLSELRLDGLLSYKLTLCALSDPDAPVAARVFGYYAERSVPVRGPFTAAYLALLDAHNATASGAGAKGGFDPSARRGAAADAKGPFVPDSNPVAPPELELGNTMSPGTLPAGVVKAVEKSGELTRITFRTEHYMVPVLDCHETDKIDRITPDGTILYRSVCKKVGEREETATNEPIAVPAYAAAGVGPGSFLLYASAPVNDDVAGQPHRGWVVEAYDSKARKVRTSLFGLAP
ncbi:MAG: hypothetical protein IPJ65_20690 [Archangiaceae bacterium]|nr:hypothetical protein [Archangiaceae bacterium]